MFIKRSDYKKRLEEYMELQKRYEEIKSGYHKELRLKAEAYHDIARHRYIQERILTNVERERVVRYYGYGWSFQDITAQILADRNDKIEQDMLQEVGKFISRRLKRQVYPIEFYGKVEEE